MTKIIAPQINCWQAFLACMLDLPLTLLEHCSTEHDDWKEKTRIVLEIRGLFYTEVDPAAMTALPVGALVGAHVEGANQPHIVIGRVVAHKDRQSIVVHHDPSGVHRLGEPLDFKTIVLLCRLTR